MHAENIRMFRKQRKLTKEKLAEALGVTVGEYINGKPDYLSRS
jgi:transcriptional regulator with XRE-family HTH domain